MRVPEVTHLVEKAHSILKLKTLHDRELWAMRLCAEITGEIIESWWDWTEIGVEK